MDAGDILCSIAGLPDSAFEAEAAAVDASYEQAAYAFVAVRYCWLFAMPAEEHQEAHVCWVEKRKQTRGGAE